jgi:hypothetical protein
VLVSSDTEGEILDALRSINSCSEIKETLEYSIGSTSFWNTGPKNNPVKSTKCAIPDI